MASGHAHEARVGPDLSLAVVLAPLKHVLLAVLDARRAVHHAEATLAELRAENEIVDGVGTLAEERAEDVVIDEAAEDAGSGGEVKAEDGQKGEADGGEQRRGLAAKVGVQGGSVDLIAAVLDLEEGSGWGSG